jgi:hypothetical protein
MLLVADGCHAHSGHACDRKQPCTVGAGVSRSRISAIDPAIDADALWAAPCVSSRLLGLSVPNGALRTVPPRLLPHTHAQPSTRSRACAHSSAQRTQARERARARANWGE